MRQANWDNMLWDAIHYGPQPERFQHSIPDGYDPMFDHTAGKGAADGLDWMTTEHKELPDA